MWVKYPVKPSDKQHKDTRREDTNNRATKSFKSYYQSLKPPVEIQGLHNTVEPNLFSKLVLFLHKCNYISDIKRWRNLSVAFV